MNLIKEFSKLVNGYVGSSMLTNTEYPETIQKNAEECLKIADEHAIKFAEWCLKEFYTSLDTVIDARADNMQDLLVIFKKECYLETDL
jgi:hypothetical protein